MARFRDNAMLQTRDGRLFLAAQSLDSVAIGVAQVALPWLVLDATGSEAQAGLVFMLGLAPYVVFGLPAGLIADRFRRQTVIWMAHAFQACVAVIVPVWAIFGTPPIMVVAATAFLVGSARAFSDAGAFGAISSLIGREQFSSGQAILAASWSIGLVAGPAIGGALIGVVGAAATLGVQAVAFALAAVLILLVRSSFGDPVPSEDGVFDGTWAGVQFLLRDPMLRTLSGIGTLWNLAAAGSWALAVPLLRQEVGLSAHEAGAALAAGALAGILAAPVLHRIEKRWRGPKLYVMTIFWSAPPIAALGLAVGFWGALAGMVLVNLIDWIVMSVFIGERQRRAPDDMQARVGISGRMLMTASMTVGTVIASGLTTFLSLREVFVAMAVTTLLVGAVAVPLVRRAERQLSVAEPRRIGRRNVVKRLQGIEGEPGRSIYAGGEATFERAGETLTVRPAFGMSHEMTYDRVRCGPCIEALERDAIVGVVLVRLGGYAIGVFVGEKLESSKVGTRNVHGRHRAGGSSANRFRRRREGQAAVLHESAAATAARILLPWVGRLEAVVLGGDREAVKQTLAERADLAPIAALAQARFLAVPDPRLRVLQGLPYELYSAEVVSIER